MSQPDPLTPLGAASASHVGLGIAFVAHATGKVDTRAAISFASYDSDTIPAHLAALGLLMPAILGTTRTGRCVFPITDYMVSDHAATPTGLGYDSASVEIDALPVEAHLTLRDGHLEETPVAELLCNPVFSQPWTDDDGDIVLPAGLPLAAFAVQRLMVQITQDGAPDPRARSMMMRGLAAAISAQMMPHLARAGRVNNRARLGAYIDLLRDGVLYSEGPACPAPEVLHAPIVALLATLPRNLEDIRALEDGPGDDASHHERMRHHAAHEALFTVLSACREAMEDLHGTARAAV